jgi:nucleotide-binding universal stress UspA family protein
MLPLTVVVPLDGSEIAARAVPVASAIARQCHGRVLLLTTHWDSDVTAPREYLAQLASAQDVEVDTVVIHDRPAAEAIAVVARAEPGRVVCMTSHGRGRLRWALLGSVAEQVVSESPEPVVLLGHHCRTEWPNGLQRLLVCVDGSSAAPAVLPTAIEWAKALELDVDVAMVIHPLDTTMPDDVVDAIAGKIEAEGLRVRKNVIPSSYPAGALADLAETLDVGLVAMSSHARTGAARFTLGSVTMGVVGMARCPVLVATTR